VGEGVEVLGPQQLQLVVPDGGEDSPQVGAGARGPGEPGGDRSAGCCWCRGQAGAAADRDRDQTGPPPPAAAAGERARRSAAWRAFQPLKQTKLRNPGSVADPDPGSGAF
jgi:hypothetical protein